MIYPSEVGKGGEMLRLRTLESVWIQGKLRMWGRWSYIGGGRPGNMFNQLLTSNRITKTELQKAVRRLKKSGLSKSELAIYLADIINDKYKSSLAFCTDTEAGVIDKVISSVLNQHAGLIVVLHERYDGKGKSKMVMAADLQKRHPEMSIMTCRRRIDTWLSLAESMLYRPMCDAFDTNSERFYLKCEQETA